MADHGARGHARWSASASERNFACPGALALIESLGIEDRETEPAAWGTACHQVAERCFRENTDAAAYIGSVEKTKAFTFTFDDEMAECTQVFLDYVRGRIGEYVASPEVAMLVCSPEYQSGEDAVRRLGHTMLLEQQFDLAPIDPPLQAGGTGDVVLLFPAWGMIEVVDLKTGKKWVEAVGNKQLRTYGLGAAIANPGAWTTVKTTIVQPRVGGNPVRSEEMSVADLLDWTVDLKAAMHTCGLALETSPRNGIVAGAKISEAWVTNFLRPGDHCRDTFCPAAGRCPAIQAQAMALAKVHFQPVAGHDLYKAGDPGAPASICDRNGDVVLDLCKVCNRGEVELLEDEGRCPGATAISTPPDPKSLPVDKVVAVLDAADMIETWLNGVRQYAREIVEGGGALPTPDGEEYHLVDKQGRRAWAIEDEDELLRALMKLAALSREDLVVEKVKSPAQAEAYIKHALSITKEKAAALIAPLCPTKSSGQNLVRSNKTSRAKSLAPAQKFFTPVTE